MTHRYRSLNRFAVALALAVVFVGARVGVQMFAAPTVTFDTLPNLYFNQGQPVTVAFAANGFPTGLTYTAEGLPAGLSMAMGVDTLGHEVGILSGTLTPDTPTTSGSEGIYNVRLHASDGAVSNFFSVDVSHWNHGDVFVGAGQWQYQVYRQDGTFKTDLTVPDDSGATYGSTTGCAVNWRTGEVWATNFDDIYPALNVFTRHQGSNPLPYTDPSRRLSTERYGTGNSLTPIPGYGYPLDINPESVAFDNDGNMFVGHSFGFWNDNGDVSDANGNAIVLHHPTDEGWVYVDGAGQPLVDGEGRVLFDNSPISPAGFFERWVHNSFPVNILDSSNNPIPVPQQGGMDMHRYTPDANGNYNQADRQFFDFRYGYTGVDAIDLLSDQKTMIYTSENWYIYRYDISGAGAQLPVLGSSVVGESRPVSPGALYGLRALPPGDGTGGYLAVDQYQVFRLDENGHKLQYYDVKNDPEYLADEELGWEPNDVNGWFSIAIAPDGRTFWAATRQDVFHFDIASGAQIGTKIRATVGTLHTNAELAGLCVMAEYRAAQEVCGPTGLGNNIDDDHDGTIDEGCFRVEICSALRPGDDDGDGLIDYNDPDCGAPAPRQCVDNGPTDNSVAGICDRADYEGDNVVVPGVPLPCSGDECNVWTFNYSATGLPPGLTMNPSNGTVTGIPFYSIVNPNSETSAPVVHHVIVNSTWQRTGEPPASFSNSFDWTISNRNRNPVAVDDGPQTVIAGASFTFNVRSNDSDIDGDTFTVLSFTQPPSGQGTVTQVGNDLRYTAPTTGFGGTTTFTYRLQDSYETPGVSNDATVTVYVSAPPVANPNAYTTPEDTALTILVPGILANDTDPNNDPLHVVVATATQTSHGTVTLHPSGNGSFVYTPNANFTGTDTFTYQVNDGALDSNFTTVTITITPVDDVPVANDDAFTTLEDTAVSSTLVTNDTPSGDGGNVWSKTSNPSHGTATVNADGTFVYTPDANYSGTDSFNYRICDADGDCDPATVTITITAVDDVPVAVNDSYTTAENIPVIANMAVNDTPSPDGGNVWTKVTDPSHGIVIVLPIGTFTYTPNLFYSGTDSFTYRICDIDGDCSTATVTITIPDSDDAPVANDDAFTTAEDTPVTSTLVTNDTASSDGGNVWTKTSNPSNGTAAVNADGTFTYTPNANFSGTDSFNYRICDGDGDCDPATVTITITPADDQPVAVNDAFTTPEDTPVNGTLTGNDTPSPDGGNVWSKTSNPANGTATVNANGTFTYTPNANFSGTDSFTYQICDVDGDCSTATVTITITPVDDVPVAVNDAFTTAEDTPVSGTLTGNDTPSPDGGNVWSKVSNPSNGTAAVNPDGTFTYTPNANFTGTDSFTYKVCDADGDCSTATVTIAITPVDDAPIAVNDAFATAEDTPVSATLVTNDTLSGDGGNVWSKVSNPSNGTATVNANGTFTYTPNTNFYGVDTFTYQICDVDGDCSIATVTITITPVDEVPIAVNDNYTTTVNTPVAGTAQGNDTPSPDGGNVWSIVTGPTAAMGTVVFQPTGVFTFTPATGFSGVATFSYKVCDIDGDCSAAIVTITIPNACEPGPFTTFTQGGWGASPSGNNPAQLLATNFATVYPGGFVQIGGTKYLKFTSATAIKNFLPAGGTAARLTSSATNPTSSTGGVFAGQVLALQLNVDFSKAGIKKRGLEDQIVVGTTYTVGYILQVANDVLGGGTVPSGYSISDLNAAVDAINNNYDNGTQDLGFLQNPPACGDAQPVAVNDAFTTAEDTAVSGSLKTNDAPSTDGGNVWTKVSSPANGTATVNADGTFTYTPNANFSGTDSFTYKVCDADGDCDEATVTITITAVDDAPVAVNDAFTTAEDTPKTGTLTGNDTPSGDGGNVWSKVTNPANGTATVNADGTFTYTPNANYNGTDSFTYKVCDADNDCSTATVTITITAVDEVPVAVNDAFTTPKNTTVSGTLIGNDTTSGDGGNVWTRVTNSANGTATVNSNGTFTFVPATGFTGVTTFTYKVCDVDNDCSTATVTITITAPDDAPVAVNDAFSTPQDTPVSGTLATNDSPSDDGGNVWTRVTNSANGAATVNTNGTFTFTPTTGFSGVTTFTYKICDADNDCSTATVTITVAAAPVCSPGTFDFSGTSAESGTAGNLRTFSAAGVSVKASAFSRVKSSGAWSTAFLGSFQGGLGVTDGSEGNGSGENHTLDNVGDRTNYILLEFSQPVRISRAYLGYVLDDSDMSVWYGTKTNPYTTHQTLSDSLLSSLTAEINAGSSTVRWADLGSDVVTINTLVIAAKTTDSNDEFKLEKLETICTSTPTATGLVAGDTATIGYWQNGNGQALIKALNGSSSSTKLGNWLASTYPYLFGAQAGSTHNMTGKTNTQVAAYDVYLFGSDKWKNQVLGGAIAAYVTNSTLAGANYGVSYGFNYSATGTGAKTYNVGSNGTAIGLSNNTTYTVSQLLAQANLRKQQGTYDSNAFNVIFSDINETGDIL